MTEERIDIKVTDAVSPAPAAKLREIAASAVQADNALERMKSSLAALNASPVDKMAAASAKLVNAQAREISAAARLDNARARLAVANGKAAVETQRLATEAARTEAAEQRAAAAMHRSAAAASAAEAAALRLTIARQKQAAADDVAAAATTRHNRSQAAFVTTGKLANHQVANLAAQLNDVGVSLASGQSPWLVMVQQGSQIASVFGPGTGVLGILKGIGQTLGTLAVAFAPALAIAGAVAGSVALLSSEIRKTTGVAVTMGDTVTAAFQLLREDIATTFAPEIKKIGELFTTAKDTIIDVFKSVYNTIAGTAKAIPILFKAPLSELPSLFRYWGLIAVEALIGVISDGFFNIELAFIALRESMGSAGVILDPLISGYAALGNVLENFRTKAAEAAEDVKKNMSDAAAEITAEMRAALNKDYAGELFDAVAKRAAEVAKARIAAEEDEKKKTAASNAPLSEKLKMLQEIQRPYAEYIQKSAILGELLQRGAITAGQFNQALASLSLPSSLRDLDASLVSSSFSYDAAVDEVRIAEQEKMNIVRDALRARIIDEEGASARLRAIEEQRILDIQDIRDGIANNLRRTDAALPSFADGAEMDMLRQQQQERMEAVQDALNARIISEEEAAKRRVEINQQAALDIQNMERARNAFMLANASSTFGALADAARGFAGEQSGIFKALFTVSKAFAIAESIVKIQQGLANAISLPFPANLAAYAAVAAQSASIITNIQAVRLRDGGLASRRSGLLSGPGGPRDDKIPAMLSDGEFVVNAAATRRNLPTLEAINSGKRVSGDAGGRTTAVYSPTYNITTNDDNESIEELKRIMAQDKAEFNMKVITVISQNKIAGVIR